MALKQTVTAQNNFGTDTELKDCYVRVDRVTGGKEQLFATASFLAPTKDRLYFEKSYEFKPVCGSGAPDFIAQSYAYLKTLPEFANATDC